MKRSTKTPFESAYGFLSPGFRVDSEGNIVARSISTVQDTDTGTVSGVFDFIVSDDEANFFIENLSGENPSITINRGSTYTFRLNLTGFTFFIKRANGVTNQTGGLAHSSGDTGVDAQGKSDGFLSFTVPLNTDDTLFYSNLDGSAIGTITVLDPVGLFSRVDITGKTQSTGIDSGTLVVDGGAGIANDLWIGGELNVAGTGISKLESTTNLNINAGNKIVLQINDIKIGEINNSGLSIPINNSNITNSNINSTVIGAITPAEATFSSAIVIDDPIEPNEVTKKSYVDLTSAAFAIALGS